LPRWLGGQDRKKKPMDNEFALRPIPDSIEFYFPLTPASAPPRVLPGGFPVFSLLIQSFIDEGQL
jgi:hypothetical protein